MQDLRQIQLLGTVFTKERDKYLTELEKINKTIANKLALINKMSGYLDDYSNQDTLKISRSVSSLTKNILLFSRKISLVISQTEVEIDRLKKAREGVIAKIEASEKKIDLMAVFEDQVKQKMRVRSEKIEQTTLDDLSVTKSMREEND